MSNWDLLLRRALVGLDSLEAKGTPIRWWSFGGGTALMLQLHHRDSKDIDLFIPDAQYLGYLSPRLTDPAVWGGPDYDETTHYVKLRYAEGEIDFIAAPSISELPNGRYEFEGHQIAIEHPAEISNWGKSPGGQPTQRAATISARGGTVALTAPRRAPR